MKKIILALIIIFLIIGGIQLYKHSQNEKKQKEAVMLNKESEGNTLNEDNWNVRPNDLIKNKEMPISEVKDFTLENLKGEKVTLSSLKGKTVLINFWATWCPPCKVEMPELEKVYQKYKDNKDIVILAVNVGEEKSKVQEFMKEHNYNFEVLLDQDSNVALEYKAKYLPTSVVINKEGKIADYKSGAMTFDQIDELIGENK